MNLTKWFRMALVLLVLLDFFTDAALAVPSYARQTGSDCAACHVGGFGPQLTPYGVQFKIGGYTDTDGQGGKVPLSAMAVASWTRTAKDQDPAPEHFSANSNGALQEASVFLAGRMTDNIGTFVQSTYSGIDRKSALDNMDIRYARSLQLGGKDAVVGLSINNNPTITDPFNTLAGWRFPYMSSELVPGYASPLIENLAQSVVGINAYTRWGKNLYGELGIYNSLSKTGLNMINAGDIGKFKGVGTYWRLAYLQDMKRDNFSVGLFGFNAGVQPDRENLGTADKYQDIGVDAGYQFLGNRTHVFTVNTSFVREWLRLNYTFTNGGSDNLKNTLDQFKVAASYHYLQTWGATASLFDTRGSTDATLNGSSLNGRPNTSGYILQADWTPWGKESSWGAPWANVRLGAQYTGYWRFNGGGYYLGDNGNNRAAKDNNTLFLFVWTAI